jgi:diaminohydroxyphosphoribosylaminopyrimidine deaminase/5-amino-6-(5-phosphoribosylamino)uracil reductase
MSISDQDAGLMRRALLLAESSIGLSGPNPRVGCVIADATGRVVGEGYTQQAGGPHAEVVALRAAQEAGADVRRGTAWVSLEPCSHHGRTPPCADALIAAGVARVVVACVDPFRAVSGQGIARLRDAGVTVDFADAQLARAARELNIGFFSRMLRARPWVRMKIAASLDGRTALVNGSSRWITQEPARADGHAWRRRADAVLTGVGTVQEDDPRLDVRLVSTATQPIRVIVDSRLRTPTSARILAPPGSVLIYCAVDDKAAAAQLSKCAAEVVTLAGVGGKVDLAALLADLTRREVNELHVEAGHKLNGSLLREGLIDELLVYLAPRLIGPGREMALLEPLSALEQAEMLRFVAVDRVGADLRLLARFVGRDEFLNPVSANAAGAS